MNTILRKENIFLNLAPMEKQDVIRKVGGVMESCGYATKNYTDGMLRKETVFNTAIGNQVAVPHGIEDVRGEVIKSGIVIMVFPDGTDWEDDNRVKLVIGIAGKDAEHIQILANIACLCSDEDCVEKITKMNVDEIYDLFTKENA